MTVDLSLNAGVIEYERPSSIWPVYPDGIACKINNDTTYVIPGRITYIDDRDGIIWTMFAYRDGVCVLESLPSRDGFSVVVSYRRDDLPATPSCILGCDVVRPSKLIGYGIGVFASGNGLFILEPTRIRVIDNNDSEIENIMLPFKLADGIYHRLMVFNSKAFIETSEGVIVFNIINNSHEELGRGTKLSDDMSAIVRTEPAGALCKLQFIDIKSLCVTAETLIPFSGVISINYGLGYVVFCSGGNIHIVDFLKGNLIIMNNIDNFAVNRYGYAIFGSTSIPKIFLCRISDMLALTSNTRSVLVVDAGLIYDGRAAIAVMD